MAGKRKRGSKGGQNGNPEPKKPKRETLLLDLGSGLDSILEKRHFVEALTPEERRREAELYLKLGSDDGEERIEAGECIISCLLEGGGVSEVVLERHLKKLMRGLASGREASRFGFSLVVTELLDKLFGSEALAETKYTGMTFDKVLGLLVSSTKAEGNIAGQETRDHSFGLAFGLESFVKSQIFVSDMSKWKAILDVLLDLSKKRIWLRPQCGYVLVQALEKMTEADTKTTLSRLAQAGTAKTPEGVAAWIVALNRYPKLRLQPWGSPLSNKSLADLTAVLKESFKEVGKDAGTKQDVAKQASWSAQLHFVWDIILARFLATSPGNSDEDFGQFWNRAVDDGLFSKQATDGQKFKGFMVFLKMLEGFAESPALLQQLFSRNFMTCLLNQAAREDRYLHRAANKALKGIEAVVTAHSSSLPLILANLLGKHGAYAFDQRTSSKTVDRLLQNTTSSNAEGVIAAIKQPMKRLDGKDAAEAQSLLRAYADYLAKVLGALSSVSSTDADNQEVITLSGAALRELANLAYSQPEGIRSDALTDKIREWCRSRLESSLARMARSSRNFAAFCEAVNAIDPNLQTMTAEIKEAVADASKRMKKLLKRKARSQTETDTAQALAMLHACSIFQLYNEDPDAMEILSDLSQFCERLHPSKSSKSSTNHDGSAELLVEILLSMVARPSSLTRQVSQQVFEAFTSQITAEGLELLTAPLASGESTQGQQELFNTDADAADADSDMAEAEDDQMIDVDEASDFEIDSDVEFVGLEGAANDTEGDDSQGAEDEDENEGSRQASEDVQWEDAEELDAKLGEILNSHRLDKDIEAQSSSDEDEMSDSDMFKLDEQLAAAMAPHMKANKPNAKKEKKEAKQSVVNFKYRILDLLETYMRNEVLNSLTFSILVPLLRLVRSTSTKSLATKASGIIIDYRKRLKKARSQARGASNGHHDASRNDTLLALLSEIHEEATQDDSHAYAKAASAASLIVASTMLENDGEAAMAQIVGVYAKTMAAWGAKECKMQKLFFDDWVNWTESHAA